MKIKIYQLGINVETGHCNETTLPLIQANEGTDRQTPRQTPETIRNLER